MRVKWYYLVQNVFSNLIVRLFWRKCRKILNFRNLKNKMERRSRVVSEKKGTFCVRICELKLERYIYLHNTQKQLKITNYVRIKSFLEFYLVYSGVYWKLWVFPLFPPPALLPKFLSPRSWCSAETYASSFCLKSYCKYLFVYFNYMLSK